MNWDHLRYFAAVAQQGSLSAAARHLNVSQATVWRKVFQLESELNTRLFETSRTGYLMTPAALKLLPLVEQMGLAAGQVNRILQQPDRLEGTVKLMAPDIMANALIHQLIDPLQQDHPGLVIELVTSSPSAPLSARDTDLSLLVNKVNTPQMSNLAQYPLPFALYRASGQGDCLGSSFDLNAQPLIDFDDDAEHMAPTGWFKRARHMRRVFRTNNPYARKQAAIAGLGLVLLPCLFVREGEGLEKVLDENDIGGVNLLLYLNKDKQSYPNVLEVSQSLQRCLPRLTLTG